MKIKFHASWAESPKKVSRIFKNSSAADWFEDYRKKISFFAPCELGGKPDLETLQTAGSAVWFCDKAEGNTSASSETLALELKKIQNNSTRELHIIIGGPDGFSVEDRKKLKGAYRWSFGPLTLPHELAAVVSAEQLYRAYAILHKHPYHGGH